MELCCGAYTMVLSVQNVRNAVKSWPKRQDCRVEHMVADASFWSANVCLFIFPGLRVSFCFWVRGLTLLLSISEQLVKGMDTVVFQIRHCYATTLCVNV